MVLNILKGGGAGLGSQRQWALAIRSLLLLAIVAVRLVPATTLTGTAKKPDGTNLNGVMYLNLSQRGSLIGGCGGPLIVLPTTIVKITVTNGSLASTSVYGNDCINPQGTYYNVRYIDNNGNTVFTDRWVITGSSVDVGTIVSAIITGTTQTLGSTGVVFFNPASNQTVAQPTGTVLGINLFAVTTKFTMPNGGFCDASGCTNVFTNGVTLDTAQTITGQKTFAADIKFSGSGIDINNPATYLWASGTAGGQALRTHFGSAVAPTDFFVFQNTAIHQLRIINSVNSNVMQFDDGGSPVWTWHGTHLLQGLTGTGNAFACIDSTGKLYRSATACI